MKQKVNSLRKSVWQRFIQIKQKGKRKYPNKQNQKQKWYITVASQRNPGNHIEIHQKSILNQFGKFTTKL